ncbi:uncharacterized protein C8R40DRAFT_1058087 [Lentinula edodes]|uniref:uncharacterized protein n=1 Tax=Lentinula edodes TaxID=5353 RepID=UPI001E8DE483|nr:uncharacterized protein C8R40DRAFT_1058087 [Lentinula edodes]KAH7869978.1 hypothetical protein C8R40DRAFT_1058087 [Lentinula edodes]
MTFATSHSPSECAASVHLIRPNEHLATLIPRSLWKPNSLSNSCDAFSCESIFLSFANFTFSFPVDFSMFKRRHHCRKCGGVFCHKCTSRTTPLLDTRNLPFLSPPRNTSIYDFGSEGGIVDSLARVCDHCWDQLHDITKKTETPEPELKPSVLSTTPCRSFVMSFATLENYTQSPTRVDTNYIPLGKLSAYPLCRSSALCKASGGGRWVPKPDEAREETPNRAPTLGIGKALWEVEWERKVRKVKRVLENPVVRDGEFCYRVYRGASLDDYRDEDVYDEYDSAKLVSLSTF